MLTLFHALFFLSTARVAFSAENAFIWPPAARQTLFIPIGTPMIVQWNSTYANLSLRLYQKDPNGPFIYQSLLTNVTGDTGLNTFAWNAHTVNALGGGMHFNVVQVDDSGQALNGFNSEWFYITNGSAIVTSGAPKSTSTTAVLSSTTTALQSASSSKKSDSNVPKLSLGLGLGLGIPLLLIIGGFIGHVLLKRLKRRRNAAASEQDVYLGTDLPMYTKADVHEPKYEADGDHAVYEVPSEDVREMSGCDVRYEMSAETDHRDRQG